MTVIAQRSFSSGEITPSLYARTDIDKYLTSVKTCRNIITQKQGGAKNRPGTYYCSATKEASNNYRMIPFIFSNSQAYVLVFGDQHIRFVKNASYVTVSGVSAWSNSTAYEIGDLVVNSSVNYYCIQAHTNQAPPNATYWYALTNDIYEIPTPYSHLDVFSINFDQSADVVTLTHPSYPAYELKRYDETDWVLSQTSFAPSQQPPTSVAVSGSSGTANEWVVTGINDETFEESLPSASVGSSTAATSGSHRTISWTVASGASTYNVYKSSNGVYGFIGVASGTSFEDTGIDPDTTETPPSARNPFSSSGDYPSTSTYYQQRHGFANTNNNTELVEFSRSANFKNFTRSTPLQSDDAVSFTMAGNQVNSVKHMIALGKLLLLTSGGEIVIEGDDAGTLRIGEVNPKQISYFGCGDLRPIVAGNSVLFIQSIGSNVIEISNDSFDGYVARDDINLFSSHLLDDYTIVDWAYQKVPNSIVWMVRSDGILVGFTYNKLQKISSWHRHDTDGEFKSVCCIPEGSEYKVYAIVERTINGSTVKYIERFESRLISDIKDMILMDSALTYDGRNATATTMTLSGGTTWSYEETLTLTASASYFSAGNVGNQIHLTGADGTILRCTITAYASGTSVSVKANQTVPVSMRSVAISTWGYAVDQISGLDHLEAKNISVFGDGYVEASPNNSSYDIVTVSGGVANLSNFYTVIHAGLPYTSDLKTLEIDTPSSQSIVDRNISISSVYAYVKDTRGMFFGSNEPTGSDFLEDLNEYKYGEENTPDEDIPTKTGIINTKISSDFKNRGSVFIRQVDPVPMEILAIMPEGYI